MLVLRVLVIGPAHGHTIAYAIERGSENVLQIEHGALYPCLHELENRGWIASFWGVVGDNRRAKYYRLTSAGRKQLFAQLTGREHASLCTPLARSLDRACHLCTAERSDEGWTTDRRSDDRRPIVGRR